MSSAEATDLVRQALTLVLVLSLPVLLTGLIVGIVMGVLQAITSVQEHALSFVPRILAMLVALLAAGAWMLAKLADFGREMFGKLF